MGNRFHATQPPVGECHGVGFTRIQGSSFRQRPAILIIGVVRGTPLIGYLVDPTQRIPLVGCSIPLIVPGFCHAAIRVKQRGHPPHAIGGV